MPTPTNTAAGAKPRAVAPPARQTAWARIALAILVLTLSPALSPVRGGLDGIAHAQPAPDVTRPAAVDDLGTDSLPPGTVVVLVGAGDIANGSSGAEATARLLDNIPGTVFTSGDNAYPDGSDADFASKYHPTWGRHRARTRPSPGNHEYHVSGAAGYYSYFGANAGPAGLGYYSYDLGDWHIISLNSEIAMSASSAQGQWLAADLAANRKDCILAYWHRPRFSSGGTHGSSTGPSPLWQALYDAGAEIVVVGHEHNYERFAPQTAAGVADPARGIRQFVAGMGGAGHYSIGTPIANSEAHNTDTYGVLKFTLGPGTYAWEFIPVAGGTYRDSGTGTCHR